MLITVIFTGGASSYTCEEYTASPYDTVYLHNREGEVIHEFNIKEVNSVLKDGEDITEHLQDWIDLLYENEMYVYDYYDEYEDEEDNYEWFK